MAALIVNTDAIVLLKRPSTSDSFQAFSVFSAGQGEMLVLRRIAKGGGKRGWGGSGGSGAALDLFSEMSLALESSNQGRAWFVREARLVKDAAGIGRDYETLLRASEFAALIARNTIAAESRGRVYELLRQAFAAFAGGADGGRQGRGGRADIVWLKAVYRFARGEGYPLREQWFAALPRAERETVIALLNKPLAELAVPPPAEAVGILRKKLEAYLREQTEILVE